MINANKQCRIKLTTRELDEIQDRFTFIASKFDEYTPFTRVIKEAWAMAVMLIGAGLHWNVKHIKQPNHNSVRYVIK